MESIARSICPFCSVGCGVLVRVVDGKPVGVEGDPAHPVNRGTLCAKGTMLVRAVTSPNRVRTVRYRAPGAERWEEKPVEWAVERVGKLIAEAGKSMMVVGGTTVDNEDAEAIAGFVRAFGANVDCHARLSHAATYTALKAICGARVMDCPPNCLVFCGAIVVWGGNPADNHPVAMQWLLRAKDKGAKLIVVDPRLTRTAAVADLHVPLRCGTDLVLIGAIIREIIARDRLDREFLAERTDAGWLISDKRGDGTALYQQNSGKAVADPAFKDEACVLRHVERRFSAYTPERVMEICGIPTGLVKKLLDLLVPEKADDKPAAIFCGQGISQQGLGVQAVHGLVMMQTLLGQVEERCGGVYALPSEANQRGAVDEGLLPDTQSQQPTLLSLADPRDKLAAGLTGLIVLAENPAVCLPQVDGFLARLDTLKWCVVVDEWETETAAFWRRPGAKPAEIKTEVFLLPMAHALERAGSMTSAVGRAQSRKQILQPQPAARHVADWLHTLAREAKQDNGPAPPRPQPNRKTFVRVEKIRLAIGEWREHYLPAYDEPTESSMPGAFVDERLTWKEDTARAAAAGERVTAFCVRLGEHSQQGLMTRSMPWLVEMAPGPFVEISKSLAKKLGIRHGETVVVRHDTRGELRLPAMVTGRLQPLTCFGKPVEQVAIVGQFGFCGLATGPTASRLASLTSHHRGIDGTPEQKPFLVKIEKAT